MVCRVSRVAAVPLVMLLPAALGAAAVTLPKLPSVAALVTAFPSPGDRFAAPAGQLVFRGADAATVARAVVSGSRSGTHAGSARTLPEGRGAVFEPAKSFVPGETVTVHVGVPVRGATGGDYAFQVARPAAAPAALRQAPAAPAAPAATADGCTPPAPSYQSRPDLAPVGACTFLDTKRSAAGYLLAAPKGGGRGGPTIYTDDGSVVWTKREVVADAHNLQVITVQGNKRLVYFRGGWLVFGLETRGVFIVLDEHYREVGRIQSSDGYQPSLHELRITPQGTALIGSYAPVLMTMHGYPVVVYDYVVQEVDFQHDGATLFEWHALDHVPLDESHVAVPGPLGTFDYFHGNSIDLLPDGNLLVSGRSTWSVYEISRSDGHVLWTLGSPANGKGTFGPSLLGSDLGWFCYQHDARVQPDGTITLFDNGGGGPGCGHPARALTLRVDPAARTATVVTSLRHHPDIYTTFGGDTEAQPNGDHLVSWADTKRLTEFDTNGAPTLEMTFGQLTYRVYRSEWHGYPLSPPDAVVDGSRVYVSWNGATEVAKWQLLGGPSRDALRKIGDPVAKQGFETSIAVPAGTSVVAVQALDANGNALSHGRAVAGTGARGAPAVGPTLGKILGILLFFGGFGLPLLLALFVGLLLGAILAAVRLARGRGLRKALYGLAGVTLLVMIINLAAGMAQSLYPPLLYLNLIYPIAFLVTNLIGWPLIGLIAGLIAGWGTRWRRNPALKGAFMLAGWLWLGFFALKVAVQLPLYLTDNWAGLAIAKVLTGWPLWVLFVCLTVGIVRRSYRARMARMAREADQAEPIRPNPEVESSLTTTSASPAR